MDSDGQPLPGTVEEVVLCTTARVRGREPGWLASHIYLLSSSLLLLLYLLYLLLLSR